MAPYPPVTPPKLHGFAPIGALLALGCGASSTPVEHAELAAPTERIWVVAPHPDDEVLMAGATLLDAVARGVEVEVVVMTNGDLSCGRDGWARQDESIAALAELGVDEAHVHFLGYPDGWLDALATTPIGPFPRQLEDGSCGTGATTYGRRGAEHADVHTARTGTPAAFTEANVLGDLRALLDALPPTTVHLPHAIDTHPDHAATYELVRRALERDSGPLPLLVRHVVHAGPCWPAMEGASCVPPSAAASALPPLPDLPAYTPDVVRPVDAGARVRWSAAIARYVSQLDAAGAGASWLDAFVRSTEPGWSQTLVGEGRLVVPFATGGGFTSPQWEAPFVVTGSLAVGQSLVLGDVGDRYRVARESSEVVITRGERELRRVHLPEPAEHETLSIRVVPERDGHASLELLRGGRFLAGTVDPDGIVHGTSMRSGGDESDATIVPMHYGVDDGDIAR